MTNITIDSNLRDCARALLDNKDLKWAATRAIGRALTASRAAVAKKVRSEYTVKSADIKMGIRSRRPKVTTEGVFGAVIGEGDRLRLDKFKVYRNAKSPMSVKVRKQRKASKVQGLFFANTAKGEEAPFLRSTAKRKPINILYGPSLPEMMGNKDVVEFMSAVAQDTLNKRFEHEMNYRLAQKGCR